MTERSGLLDFNARDRVDFVPAMPGVGDIHTRDDDVFPLHGRVVNRLREARADTLTHRIGFG